MPMPACILARHCSHPFLPTACLHLFVICTRLRFMPVHRSCLLLPAGHTHSWSSNSWAACIHLGALLYVPMPTVIRTRCCSRLLSMPAVVGCNTLYYLPYIISKIEVKPAPKSGGTKWKLSKSGNVDFGGNHGFKQCH